MEKALEIIKNAPFGLLATLDAGEPRIRPMAFVLEGGKLWSSTHASSGKVEELRQNGKVEICFVDDAKFHLRITGLADVTGGPDKKRRLLELNPKVRNHFKSEEDPAFVHIEVTPLSVRWKKPGFNEYVEVAWK